MTDPSQITEPVSAPGDTGPADEPELRMLSQHRIKQPPLLRVRDEPAFVLTTWPWKETSLVAELFTQNHGRVTVSVRGAKRPSGKFRGLINTFCPLMVNFYGREEVKNLTDARWLGGLSPLTGEGLLTGFYLNELVFRLTAREDPHPALFQSYTRTLAALASYDALQAQRVVRSFEVELLRESGWGQYDDPRLADCDCLVRDGQLIVCPTQPSDSEPCFAPARAVRAILTCDFSDPDILRDARRILREIIGYYVGDRGLSTRKTLAKWQNFV